MRIERPEAVGLGVALAAHAAMLWALGLGRQIAPPPPAATIEVSFVDEYGPVSSAPTAEPAAQGVAPQLGAPEEAAPAAAPAALAEPVQRPVPQPAPARAAPREPAAAQQQQRPVPQPRPTSRSGAGSGEADRASRLGQDILKGIGNDPAARSQRPAGAVMTPQASADIASLILRQVQPCANRQRSPGPGAERIRVTIRLQLNRNGSLAAPPTVVGRDGLDDDNRRYADRVDDLAIATFAGCSPLRGLPAELYDVARGWRDFRLRYRLPG